ncbi:hypothetical protein LINGRAHAP2_LOCUS2735, partial [Linum grandiflorum]
MDDRKDLGDAFVNDVWGNVLYAYTEGWFWTKWAELAKGGHAEALVDYLQKEWIPCRHRWAHYHTNKVFHLGNTSTNRVESSHSSLKSWLHGSTHKTDTFFLSYHGLMESQGVEIRKLLEDSRLKVFSVWEPPYGKLNTEVSLWAIELLEKDRKSKKSCHCVLKPTRGLPCTCTVRQIVEAGKLVSKHDLHPFWATLD